MTCSCESRDKAVCHAAMFSQGPGPYGGGGPGHCRHATRPARNHLAHTGASTTSQVRTLLASARRGRSSRSSGGTCNVPDARGIELRLSMGCSVNFSCARPGGGLSTNLPPGAFSFLGSSLRWSACGALRALHRLRIPANMLRHTADRVYIPPRAPLPSFFLPCRSLLFLGVHSLTLFRHVQIRLLQRRQGRSV